MDWISFQAVYFIIRLISNSPKIRIMYLLILYATCNLTISPPMLSTFKTFILCHTVINFPFFFFCWIAASSSVPLNCEEVQDNNPKPERSSFDRPMVPSRSQHVLPSICILWQKEKTIRCRVTHKRKKEHLVKCSTIDAVNLKQAAEDNKNETLLMQIKDKDCVAIEVRYHNSCYKDYTRYLTKA